MTPNNRKPYNEVPGPGGRKGNTGKSPARRIKMLLATGAVAGTLGGWALLSQQDMVSAQQASAQPAATAIVLEQSTATATSTSQAVTSTPAVQATATTEASTATPTAQPTATATPQATATATTVKQAATATPVAVTTTRSSR